MWQRLTESVRKAVFYGQEEAQNRGVEFVDADLLLLGCLRADDADGERLLDHWQVPLVTLRKTIDARLPSRYHPSINMTLTPDAKQALDHAKSIAEAMGEDLMGAEHLIAGIALVSTSALGSWLGNHALSVTTVGQAIRAARQPGSGDESGTRD